MAYILTTSVRKFLIDLTRTIFLRGVDILEAMRGGEGRDKIKILLVRGDGIGDYILWLDAARGLRDIYPPDRYELTLLCNKVWEPLALDCPYFDRIWSLDRRRYRQIFYHFGLMAMLRRACFDIAIQPTYSRDFIGDTVMRFCGARERIGSAGDASNIDLDQKSYNDRTYTKLVPAKSGTMMELERNAEFMRGLGFGGFTANVPEIKTGRKVPFGLEEDKYYVIFPGASWYWKKWSVLNFAELARRLYDKKGWFGVICGGPAEIELGDSLLREAGVPMRNLAGQTNLKNLAGIIMGSRILLSNDTSAVHMAAAVSTPSICILGGGHYGRFLPYVLESKTDRPMPVPVNVEMACFGCNWKCTHKTPVGEPVPCISDITVDMAWTAVSAILQGVSDEE